MTVASAMSPPRVPTRLTVRPGRLTTRVWPDEQRPETTTWNVLRCGCGTRRYGELGDSRGVAGAGRCAQIMATVCRHSQPRVRGALGPELFEIADQELALTLVEKERKQGPDFQTAGAGGSRRSSSGSGARRQSPLDARGQLPDHPECRRQRFGADRLEPVDTSCAALPARASAPRPTRPRALCARDNRAWCRRRSGATGRPVRASISRCIETP